MRVGVFGGTFDPVHIAHLILAEQCRDQAKLDQVLFIPASTPPHKQRYNITPFGQRVEMLSLAISGQAAFRINELEKDRAGPSFTADTLTQLHRAMPGNEWFFILGSDSVRDLPMWYQPRRILELAALLVVARADFGMLSEAELRAALKLEPEFPLRCQTVEAPLIGVSSSDIRQRLACGRSVRYLVPRAVEAFIEDKKLYRV
jgi:nicotinate-nucleotide adenylyltransferase